jgi:hypothetical protein
LIGKKQTFGCIDLRNPVVVLRYKTANEELADYLLANGVTFATGAKAGDKWTPTEPLTNYRQWISVKERLPEEGAVVMCRHKAREYPLFLRWNEGGLCWEDSAWIYGTGSITHWMPLPEPSKEE